MQTRHYYITLQNAQLATLLSQWDLKLNCKMCLISSLIYVRNCSGEYPFWNSVLPNFNYAYIQPHTCVLCFRKCSKFCEYQSADGPGEFCGCPNLDYVFPLFRHIQVNSGHHIQLNLHSMYNNQLCQ